MYNPMTHAHNSQPEFAARRNNGHTTPVSQSAPCCFPALQAAMETISGGTIKLEKTLGAIHQGHTIPGSIMEILNRSRKLGRKGGGGWPASAVPE